MTTLRDLITEWRARKMPLPGYEYAGELEQAIAEAALDPEEVKKRADQWAENYPMQASPAIAGLVREALSRGYVEGALDWGKK